VQAQVHHELCRGRLAKGMDMWPAVSAALKQAPHHKFNVRAATTAAANTLSKQFFQPLFTVATAVLSDNSGGGWSWITIQLYLLLRHRKIIIIGMRCTEDGL